jgi:hypothetical protein
MDCEQFQDSVFSAANAADIGAESAEHARLCESCAAFLADMQAIEDALRPGSVPAAPSRVWGALSQEFRRMHPAQVRDAAPSVWDPRAWLTPARLAWSAGLAAAIVLLVHFAPGKPDRGDGLSARLVYTQHGD